MAHEHSSSTIIVTAFTFSPPHPFLSHFSPILSLRNSYNQIDKLRIEIAATDELTRSGEDGVADGCTGIYENFDVDGLRLRFVLNTCQEESKADGGCAHTLSPAAVGSRGGYG